MLKKLKLIYLCFKHLQNSTEVISDYLSSKPIVAKIKSGKSFNLGLKKGSLGKLLLILDNGWDISYNFKKNNFLFEQKNIRFVQPDFGVLHEELENTYISSYNLKNKVILDVGGYRGETAILFVKTGFAKKVIVYEPVKENIGYIKKNIILNKLNTNIILKEFGVGNNTESIIINSVSSPGNSAFGLPGNAYKLKINLKSWEYVLKNAIKNKVYLAKVDCEGAEKYLVNVNKGLIKKISIWIIETHSKEIKRNILNLFKNLGYSKRLLFVLHGNICMWEFKRD